MQPIFITYLKKIVWSGKLFQILILNIFAVSTLFSQVVFDKGYYIDNSDQKTECLIRGVKGSTNPDKFQYKTDSSENIYTQSISEVKEFAIINGSKYVRVVVELDTSLVGVGDLDYEKQAEWKTVSVFLKVHIEGKANLYSFNGYGVTRYFYSLDSLPAKQLVYKKYLTKDGNVAENKMFIRQLFSEVNCNSNSNIASLKYHLHDLVKYFSQYNTCKGVDSKTYISKKKKLVANIKIVAGINYSSLDLNLQDDYHFDPEVSILFGFETELILPFNENRWSAVFEPVYGYYKSETEQTNIVNTSTANIDFKYFEIQAGLRYSFFLNKNLKLYLNPLFIYDIPVKSTLSANYISGTTNYNMSSQISLAIGIGCTYKNFSIELDYFPKRDLIPEYVYYGASFNNMSFSMKYRFYTSKSK